MMIQYKESYVPCFSDTDCCSGECDGNPKGARPVVLEPGFEGKGGSRNGRVTGQSTGYVGGTDVERAERPFIES
ncbi:hypothetical protein WAI453_013496 [Rhynchosporium graminicola]